MAGKPSSKLPASLLIWIEALASSLPSLSDLDEATGKPRRVVRNLADLNDGVVLGDVVGELDPAYFRPLAPQNSSSQKALNDNWVLRFNNLKRLYKLLIRYFEDVLHATTAALPAPNLQLIAKGGEGSEEEICRLAGLVLALVVQSDQRQQHVERIQGLDQWVQREIMWSIEQVMSKIVTKSDKDKDLLANYQGADADSEFYDLQQERSRLLNDKETLQVVYEELVRSYNTLKGDHEEALASLSKADARAAEAAASVKNVRADVTFKAEFDRLRNDLQKAENELGESEQIVDRQTKMLEDLTRKVEELTPRAEEATRLKDQMDEYRHAAEKAKKTENAIEKYKKKLEESADLRRSLKSLEDQNSDLLDQNSALQEDFAKVSAFKPLMKSYKSKLDALETRNSQLVRENDSLRHGVQRATERLRVSEQEREKEGEALALFEERVKELEHQLGGGGKAKRRASHLEEDEEDSLNGGVGGELDDALSGTTMTDLKLQVRKLKRELDKATVNKADASRVLVLENLLKDANRMKARYESGFLREHREKLVVSGQLEEILSGKSKLGDRPEAAMALRLRLNQTVEKLESLQKTYAALEVKHEAQNRELTIAKSDLNLVNKDQVDILKSLRASVSVEKDALAQELERLKKTLQAAEDKVKMQMSQVNTLLMEKVSLQSDGIGQREKMLDQERNLSDLKSSMSSSRGLSDQDREHLAQLEGANAKYEADVRDLKEKLHKAKDFIKKQDKSFRKSFADEQHGHADESVQSYRSQITTLTEELERQKTNSAEIEGRYRREQQLMLSAWHDLSMRNMRDMVANAGGSVNGASRRAGGSSWIAQQRARSNGISLS